MMTSNRHRRGHFTIPSTSSEHQHDDYWKLKSYKIMTGPEMRDLLQSRNYPFPKRAINEILEVSLLRSDSGMPSYAGKSDDQLRDLIRARRIDATGIIEGRRRGGRHDLLSLLEVSDMNPRFHRFSDLPAELRNRIYEYYFAEIKQTLYAPSEPPISRVSKVIRKETIKMYYNSCTFDLVLRLPRVRQAHDRALPRLLGEAHTLTIPSQMRLFITNIASDNLSSIRRINVRLVRHKDLESSYHDDETVALSIELPEQGEEYTLEVDNLFDVLQDHGSSDDAGFLHSLSNRDARRQVRILMKHVDDILKDIIARQGKAKLRMGDFFALRRAVEAGLRPRAEW